jgi:hypothetical protein
MPLHAACRHYSPNSPAAIRSNHGNQVTTCTRLAKNCPADFSYATTPSANNPRWMTIFINDLFDFFWLYTVPGNVFNVVLIPLRLQLPELHKLKLAQGNAGFEALTYSVLSIRPVGRGKGDIVLSLAKWFSLCAQPGDAQERRGLRSVQCATRLSIVVMPPKGLSEKNEDTLWISGLGSVRTARLGLEARLWPRGRPQEQCEK